ncbi:MAG: DUF92 domain-containing protein [Phaeodactylibacter sp.]|nr:DUF92 domain-containing protein [Phaeodactylibacter sp.]
MSFDDLKWVHLSDAVFFLLLPVAAVLSVRAKSISVGGALTGMAIVVGLYLGGSWLGAALLAIFFVAGSFATKWKQEAKISMGVAQESEGQRGWVNAASNGAVAAFFGVWGWWTAIQEPFVFPMMAAAIASATSDTLSSELGNIYGRHYRNILNWKPGRRGEDGMISLEGTLFGIAGTFLIALPTGLYTQSWSVGLIVGLAGFAGNLSDSLLGAALQQQGRLNNHAVNFWSTLIAALIAGLLSII